VKFVEGLVGLVYACSCLCPLQCLVLDRWLNMLSSHVIYNVLIRCTNVLSVMTLCGPNVLPEGSIYEGKSLNNRKFYTRNNFFTRVRTEIVCVLFFDIAPLPRNTLGPPVHKLADAL